VLGTVEVGQYVARDVTQPPGQPVSFDGRTDRSRNDQPEFGIAGCTPHIDDHVRLDGFPSPLDRCLEIGRPSHPVTRGKHRRFTERSSSQRTTALAAPTRHDGAAGASPHAQPESVHAGTAPVVRLEGPLALCHDSLLAATDVAADPVPRAGGLHVNPRRLDKLHALLVADAHSGPLIRIAAASPTSGTTV